MEDFANLRRMRGLLAGAGLLTLAACGGGPAPADMRGVAIVPPSAPPNPSQALQQQMAQQQMAPMQTGPAPGGGGGGAGALAGHLASYRTAESAQTGWRDLVKAQPALQTLKPYFVPVTINGAPWVRLLAGDFPNRDEVNRFCNWARAQKLYCAPMPVSGASQATPPAVNAAPAGTAPRPRQPRGTPQSGDMAPAPAAPVAVAPPPAAPSMLTPGGAEPLAAAPAMVAPAPAATPPQPLAPPLPPRRQPTQPALPQ